MQFNKHQIKDICKIIGGQPAPKGDNSFCSVGLPFVRMKDFGRYHLTNNLFDVDDCLSEDYLKRSKVNIVKKGSILLPRSGSVGLNHRAILGRDAVIVSHICALEVLDKKIVNNSYLYYYLQTIDMVSITKKTTGLDAITFEDLGKIKIPIPPISYQIRIATILDHADSIRRKNKQILEKYNELAQSVFYEMFGDPVTNPKGWEMMSGEQYCDSISVGVVVRPASYYVKEGIPALRSLNIRPNRIQLNDLVYFSSKSNEKELSKSIIRQNDVLIVRTGQPGTAAIVPKALDGANCIDLIITRPMKSRVNPVYYSHFFNTDGGKKLVLGTQRGQIQKHFNIGEIRKALIPLPPLNAQNKFALIIEQIETQKRLSQNSLTKSENLFQSLLQKAFKGEL